VRSEKLRFFLVKLDGMTNHDILSTAQTFIKTREGALVSERRAAAGAEVAAAEEQHKSGGVQIVQS
jgi:predicted metal-binding protein